MLLQSILTHSLLPPVNRQSSWILSASKRQIHQAFHNHRNKKPSRNNPHVYYSPSRGSTTVRNSTLMTNRRRVPNPATSALLQSAVLRNRGAIATFSSQFPGGGGGRGSPWMRGAGMMGASAMVLFGKGKYILGALKVTKLASLGSMVLTVGAYTAFFGFPYAVGMVGLILVHEVGHAAVMIQRGIPFSPMVFVPFMGAMISMNRRPRDAWEDALVAFGGPVLGSVGAAGMAVGGHMTDSQLLFALADFGFMINLFNLLPIGSMDGGRIAGALSPWTHVAGLGIGGSMALSGAIQNPIFYLILLGGGWETYQRFTNPNAVPPNYYRITPVQRAAIGLGYVGLAGGLALAMDVNQHFKKHPEILERERAMEKSWDMR